MNFVDACTFQEVAAYPKALGNRREDMYISYSYDRHEVRFKNWAESAEKLQEGFASGLKEVGLEYVDLWRIMFHEQTGKRNTEKEVENAMKALAWAKKRGLARHTGFSSHDRKWITKAVADYPQQVEAVFTPYTAFSKKAPNGSMFEALAKHDVGFVGIKPFASGSVFKSRGKPDSSTKEQDDKRARMVLRGEMAAFCSQCHLKHKNPDKVKEFRKKNFSTRMPNGRWIDETSVCLDCHGNHAISTGEESTFK